MLRTANRYDRIRKVETDGTGGNLNADGAYGIILGFCT
jgi:hypothetical protein